MFDFRFLSSPFNQAEIKTDLSRHRLWISFTEHGWSSFVVFKVKFQSSSSRWQHVSGTVRPTRTDEELQNVRFTLFINYSWAKLQPHRALTNTGWSEAGLGCVHEYWILFPPESSFEIESSRLIPLSSNCKVFTTLITFGFCWQRTRFWLNLTFIQSLTTFHSLSHAGFNVFMAWKSWRQGKVNIYTWILCIILNDAWKSNQ